MKINRIAKNTIRTALLVSLMAAPLGACAHKEAANMTVWDNQTAPSSENQSDNHVEGKVLNVIGDSYVANHRRPKEETWHFKLAHELGLTYNNYGRNGSCVAFDRTHDGPYNFGEAMWVRCKTMDPSADYVIIIAGHNDADKVKANRDSLRMFVDSLEVMLDEIQELCPKAKIGYVTPWWVNRPGFAPVCKAIKKACGKRGIPVLMNYTKDCVIRVRDDEFRKRYFQGANDTAHLNAQGHDLFLPVAREWFERKMLGGSPAKSVRK